MGWHGHFHEFFLDLWGLNGILLWFNAVLWLKHGNSNQFCISSFFYHVLLVIPSLWKQNMNCQWKMEDTQNWWNLQRRMDIEPMVWLSLIFYWRFLVFATRWADTIFPQQRNLMGSSAQNSSSVHWCRRRVRFNEVPEKVLKVPDKVWEALVQRQVRFNRLPEKVPQKFSGEGLGGFGAERVPVKVWEALAQSQDRFNSILEKVLEKV